MEVNDGDAGAAVLERFVFDLYHAGESADIFADLLAEDAGTLAVEDADLVDAYHEGVVHETLDGDERFVETLAADIDLRPEVQAVLGHRVVCEVAAGRSSRGGSGLALVAEFIV